MKSIARTSKSFLYLVLPLLLIMSCKVHFITDYNADIAKQIDETEKMVDGMYLKMTETTQQGQRPYSKFEDKYLDVEIELNSLLNRNKRRTLNENSIKICEDALKLWISIKEDHKNKNDLSDDKIILKQNQMNAIFFAMQKAEDIKKISTPQK